MEFILFQILNFYCKKVSLVSFLLFLEGLFFTVFIVKKGYGYLDLWDEYNIAYLFVGSNANIHYQPSTFGCHVKQLSFYFLRKDFLFFILSVMFVFEAVSSFTLFLFQLVSYQMNRFTFCFYWLIRWFQSSENVPVYKS